MRFNPFLSFLKTFSYVLRGRLHFPRNRIGEVITMEDGQEFVIKSVVERIDVDDTEAKVYYTIPMPSYSVSEETVGVLPFVHHG